VHSAQRTEGPAIGSVARPDIADPMAIVIITTFDLDEYVHCAP
jgi:hypothetical protein